MAQSLGFRVALDVSLDSRPALDGLLVNIETQVSWPDVPILPLKLHDIGQQLRQILTREVIVSEGHIDELSKDFEVSADELWAVVHNLCDAGEVVVVSDSDATPLYITFERWSREVEHLDMMARASLAHDGRICSVLVPGDDQDVSSSARVTAAVIAQLVSAGFYSWDGNDLVRRRASRLSQPIRCFISDASSDKQVADVIARLLRSRNIDVWLDAWEIKPGDSIVSRIEDGLDSSTAVLALLSPDSLRSAWVQEESRMAVYRRVTDPSFRVIPVIVEKCEVPGFLRGLARLDWRQKGEHGILRMADQLREARLGRMTAVASCLSDR